MAPRRKSLIKKTVYNIDPSEKENVYLHNVSDFNAKIRRRESLRSAKCLKVSICVTVKPPVGHENVEFIILHVSSWIIKKFLVVYLFHNMYSDFSVVFFS